MWKKKENFVSHWHMYIHICLELHVVCTAYCSIVSLVLLHALNRVTPLSASSIHHLLYSHHVTCTCDILPSKQCVLLVVRWVWQAAFSSNLVVELYLFHLLRVRERRWLGEYHHRRRREPPGRGKGWRHWGWRHAHSTSQLAADRAFVPAHDLTDCGGSERSTGSTNYMCKHTCENIRKII